MDNWDTVLGQRAMESIIQIANNQIELRDYFAGQFLSGKASNTVETSPETLAKLAYEYADAMMKARK
jgi:hypothetical protein